MRDMTLRSPSISVAARSTVKAAPQAASAARTAGSQDVLALGDRPYNALQRHGAFFDANNDHKVTYKETAQGLKDMGLGRRAARVLGLITTVGLALPQRNFLTIELDRVNAQIDARTPGAFDAEGHFDAAKFEKMFAFDRGKTGSLTEAEIGRLIDASALTKSGKFRTKAGYNLLFKVGADVTKPVLDEAGKQVVGKDGKPLAAPALSRDRLKSFFTGSIFYDIAAAKGHPRPVRDGLK